MRKILSLFLLGILGSTVPCQFSHAHVNDDSHAVHHHAEAPTEDNTCESVLSDIEIRVTQESENLTEVAFFMPSLDPVFIENIVLLPETKSVLLTTKDPPDFMTSHENLLLGWDKIQLRL